jgi:hypothetical protein
VRKRLRYFTAMNTKSLFTVGEQGTLIVPPNIESMMCGVATVFMVHPRYRLTYTDGSHEEAVCDQLERGASVFAITSAVQSKRVMEAA